jgi:hypothetical protein
MKTLLKTLFILLIATNTTKAQTPSIRVNLYGVDSSGLIILDGALIQYGPQWCSCVDISDAFKMSNPGVNISVHKIQDNIQYDLVVERRNLNSLPDTSNYRLWNLIPNRNYALAFIKINLPDVQINLFDSKTNSQLLISGDTTWYYFNSFTPSPEDRFKLAYKPIQTVPVTFVKVETKKENSDAVINWWVENELNVVGYSVERSTNGVNFNEVKFTQASNKKQYSIVDKNVPAGKLYYRIKNIDIDGQSKYSKISTIDVSITQFKVYPNPVVNNNKITISKPNNDKYSVFLVASNGTQKLLGTITNSNENLNVYSTPGYYQLLLVNENSKINVPIVIQ